MTEPLVIGIDASRAVRSNRTGTENYSFELIKQIINLDHKDHLRLYAPHESFEKIGSGPQVEWKILPEARLWSQLTLSKELRRNEPDVLFVPSHVIPLLSKVKSVVTIHDLAYRFFPQSYSNFDRRYINFATSVSVSKASKIIVPSHATKNDLVKLHKIDPKKIVVIPLGYNEDVFNPNKDYQDSPMKRPYFFYVNRLEYRKNTQLLIDAFVLLAKERKDVDLVLAGKAGYGYVDIERKLNNLPAAIRSRIITPGYLPQYDSARYMKHALALVCPSIYEGFGLPILEAMAIGTPVIASNSSSLPEVAGDAAILLPPNNPLSWAASMSRIIHQKELSASLRAKGIIQAKKFSWAAAAKATLEVIHDVAKG